MLEWRKKARRKQWKNSIVMPDRAAVRLVIHFALSRQEGVHLPKAFMSKRSNFHPQFLAASRIASVIRPKNGKSNSLNEILY